MRAGADQALVIHRGGIAAEVEKNLRASKILGALRELRFVEEFPFRRPRTPVYKTAVAADRYLIKVALYVLRESAVYRS